jgi:hypothetical protein
MTQVLKTNYKKAGNKSEFMIWKLKKKIGKSYKKKLEALGKHK